jgi:hypothetical protein
MAVFRTLMRGPASAPPATNRRSAYRVRRLAGIALNFFALVLVANQLWPGLAA